MHPESNMRDLLTFCNQLYVDNLTSVWRATLAVTIIMVAGGLPVTPALAQDEGAMIEEVVVTAQRREQSLQETPLSITAFTAEEMAERSFTNLRQIGDATPNMRFTAAGTSSGRTSEALVFIRGIGQTDAWMTADPGVGIYVDGVYLARAAGSIIDLIDVERIEVLRGPQGTLFGRNTIGGAINVITTVPGEEKSGKAQFTTGRFGRIDVDAAFNGPLTENLYAKVAVASRKRDGYIKNLWDGAWDGDEDRQTIRGGLRWLASDDIEVTLNADYTRIDQNGIGWSNVDINPQASLAGLWNFLVSGSAGVSWGEHWEPPKKNQTYGGHASVEEVDAWGVSMTVDWDLGSLALKSITSYRDLDSLSRNDGDASPVPFDDSPANPELQDQFTQEFQFSGQAFDDRLNWIAGAYYFTEEPSFDTNISLATGTFEALEAMPGALFPLVGGVPCPPPPGVFLPCAGGAGNPFNVALDIRFKLIEELENTGYALFTQGTFDITDQLGLTAGVRYNYEEKDFSVFQQHPTGQVQIDASANDDWASWTPKVSIEYQIDSDYMVYASASRGFKSGGWNGRPTDEGGIQTYEEEFVWAYEVGFKTDWWNNRIRLNGAAYFNDYSDIQLVSSQADPETGVMRIITENGGDAEIMGFELEITALPLPELRLSAGVGTLDFEYTDFARPNCAVAPLGTSCTRLEEGNVLPQAPELTFNLSAQYMVSLTNAAKVLLQGDYYYVDKFYVDPFNVEAIAAPSSEMINMRIAYVAPDDKWEVAAFVTNLTDEINIVNGFEVEAFGARAVTYSRPREWGLSVKYQY